MSDRVSPPVCESCGMTADVMLDDGSIWCLECDASARNMGLDDRVITHWLPASEWVPVSQDAAE